MKSFRFVSLVAVFVGVGGALVWRSFSQPKRHDGPHFTVQSAAEGGRPLGEDARNPSKESAGRVSPVSDFPPDSIASSNSVERAVADGVVLASRLETDRSSGVWTRLRLVRTNVQPRPVRVEESWVRAAGTGAWVCRRRDMYLADQLIVKARRGISLQQLTDRLAPLGLTIDKRISDGVFTVRLARADLEAVPEGLRLLGAQGDIVETAEMDGVGFGSGVPNDPRFDEQWGLHNTGQSAGTADADVDAPEFWELVQETPGMVIAVLDSGLNFTHPDLQNIAWKNPGEVAGDGIDNDGNGRVDDVNGWDFVNGDNSPADDHGHGSNVTGIIAANRNNGVGIAGLIGGVRIVVCKILNSSNAGTTSTLIAATAYARQRGVPVMNLSLQEYPFSTTLENEFTACQNAGILLCICAGNQGVNNDAAPNYPSSYGHPNIIAVGNHDRTDARWAGASNPSNYGHLNVDLFAPGRLILSPTLGTSYTNFTGTSQATPFVTAVATALKYRHPAWGAPEIKQKILSSVVVRPAYAGLCVTGGRLNAANALAAPAIVTHPANQTAAPGSTVTFNTVAGGLPPPDFQWQKDGVSIQGATSPSISLSNIQSADAGIYTAVVSDGIAITSDPAILGIISAHKVIGAGAEVGFNIFVAANNNTFDQVLLQGASATITADLAQITRISFVDLSDDIVQVEFSGAGTLTLVLENASGPGLATNYNQPAVAYMKGHAGIIICGANETTHVAIFSVGRITAVNQALFKSEVSYDGLADVAYIAILSETGQFGGIRAANASFFATKGLTGIYAPDVRLNGPVFVGNINASDTAIPVLLLGSAADTRITGGDLLQTNAQPVKVSGIAQLKFVPGVTSHGASLPAQANRARLLRDGIDVTAQIVVPPGL